MQATAGDLGYLRTAFLERLAHELRGPAGVIHGAMQELEAALGSNAQEHELFLSMAKRGLKRILRTADRLQHTGQLERGPLSLTRSDCDLALLLKHSVDEAFTIESRKKIKVELDVPEGQRLIVADSHWISIALFELASNAIRHASERVQVQLRSGSGVGTGVDEIVFTDDGRSSFEFGPSRFVPGREARGLGLGLAIASDVVLAHAGTLAIECGRTHGQDYGGRVQVSLPRA
jgi:signal transduction histidine kinase